MNEYMTPIQRAGLRFGRIVIFGGASAVIAVALQNANVFDGTAAAVFIPALTAGLAALDKYVRAFLEEEGEENG